MKIMKKNLKKITQKFNILSHYKTIFTKNLFYKKNKLIYYFLKNNYSKEKKKILIIIDNNVIKKNTYLLKQIKEYFIIYKNSFTLITQPIIIKGGELIKNDKNEIENLYNHINKYNICRHSYIIAIGGGAILDIVGFITSTAHRGIRLIRIPTTTLSQNDSGVGVKNGINYFKKKNFIGTFSVPEIVINDFTYLKTLTKKNLISGISEAIKIALIKNKYYFLYIKKYTQLILNRNIIIITKINYLCAYLHMQHISKNYDPFEKFSSRPLDFGHWTAHKLESLNKNKLTHGFAVAIGIAIDCTYAFLTNLLKKKLWQKVIETLLSLNFYIYNKKIKINKKNIFFEKSLNEFKEHLGGKLTITLLKDLGKKITINSINLKKLKQTVVLLKKIQTTIN